MRKKEWEKQFQAMYPGTIHQSHEAHLGANCKLEIKQFIHDTIISERKEAVRKIIRELEKYRDAARKNYKESKANKTYYFDLVIAYSAAIDISRETLDVIP